VRESARVSSRERAHVLTQLSQENGATEIDLPDDEPQVLQALIHFLYNSKLDTAERSTTSGLSTLLVHVYAIADKYDVAALRALAVVRLNVVCDPVKNMEDFLAVLRVTDACTVEKTIWNILIPKARSHISLLLKNESFRELVVELPTLTFSLLACLENEKPSSGKLKRALEDSDDEREINGW
jgi:hypothetical protein